MRQWGIYGVVVALMLMLAAGGCARKAKPVAFEDVTVSADWQDVPLATVCEEISAATGKTILCDKHLRSIKVTAQLDAMPAPRALDWLAHLTGAEVLPLGKGMTWKTWRPGLRPAGYLLSARTAKGSPAYEQATTPEK